MGCQFILAWYYRLQRRRGKKKPFRSRKVFSGAGIPNRAMGQIFHHARAWKFIFREVFWFRRPKQSSTGKTSQGQPWRSDGLQWVWLVSGSRCRRQRCWPCEGSMPCGAGDLLALWLGLLHSWVCKPWLARWTCVSASTLDRTALYYIKRKCGFPWIESRGLNDIRNYKVGMFHVLQLITRGYRKKLVISACDRPTPFQYHQRLGKDGLY